MELKGFYNIDCMEGMKQIPDKYFELAIVDPPYGIDVAKVGKVGGNNLSKAKNYGVKEWDKAIPEKDYFEELKRVSKNQIIWGGNYFIEHLKNTPCFIVWDKDNSGNFADCELAWASFTSAVRKFEFRWNGMLQENMKHKEHRQHPTQKPVALYKWLLNNYAKPGDKILDTHVGSASSLIACYDLGFEYLGFELDADYYKMATDRLNKHMSQLNLLLDFGT